MEVQQPEHEPLPLWDAVSQVAALPATTQHWPLVTVFILCNDKLMLLKEHIITAFLFNQVYLVCVWRLH